jgi:hypothetical protein
MSSRKTTTLSRWAAWLAAGLVLAGCATTPGTAAKEDLVRQRAAQRAEAYLKGDIPASYAMLTPSYRKLRNLEAYTRTFGSGARWQNAEVSTVACTEQRCIVGLKVRVKPLIPGMFNDTITVQFEETWLLEDGNWWLHQAL